jgi:GH25 family lysozyme M1 (1,4-beta-N-acetylmuramidase)
LNIKGICAGVFLLCNSFIYGQFVHGIDVSHWQGNIDWTAVYDDGQIYSWAKATEGMTYEDPQFMANMTNGVNAGVVMGAYHFARPDNNLAIEDATNFLDVAGAYIGNGFLPPVLDLENPYSGGQAIVLSDLLTSQELTNWVTDWMLEIETTTGVSPIIYVNGNYANYLNSSVNNYGLWIANPNESLTPPTNIGVWNDWKFKQYSWWGNVSGITGDVDLNIFNGDITDFNTLIGINTAQVMPTQFNTKIYAYPNPVTDLLYIKNIPGEPVKVSLISNEGRRHIVKFQNNSIDVSNFAPGIYVLEMEFEHGFFSISRVSKK